MCHSIICSCRILDLRGFLFELLLNTDVEMICFVMDFLWLCPLQAVYHEGKGERETGGRYVKILNRGIFLQVLSLYW